MEYNVVKHQKLVLDSMLNFNACIIGVTVNVEKLVGKSCISSAASILKMRIIYHLDNFT